MHYIFSTRVARHPRLHNGSTLPTGPLALPGGPKPLALAAHPLPLRSHSFGVLWLFIVHGYRGLQFAIGDCQLLLPQDSVETAKSPHHGPLRVRLCRHAPNMRLSPVSAQQSLDLCKPRSKRRL